MIIVTIAGKRIQARATDDPSALAWSPGMQAIPGARWVKSGRYWSLPLTMAACRALREEYGDILSVSRELAKWARDDLAGKHRPQRLCRDCKKPLTRPRAEAGKRLCHPCELRARKASRARSHDRSVQDAYGLEPGEYDLLYQAQGGRCAICQVASGKARRLAVDHDHRTGEVRGLVCGPDNRFIGRGRDDPEFFIRIAEYLRNPPARKVLR